MLKASNKSNARSRTPYLLYIFAVVIISGLVTYSLYAHRLFKPSYLGITTTDTNNSISVNFSSTFGSNYYLNLAESVIDRIQDRAYNFFIDDSDEFCANSSIVWCTVPIPSRRST